MPVAALANRRWQDYTSRVAGLENALPVDSPSDFFDEDRRHSLGSQFLVHAKEIYLDSFHDLGVDVHPGWHGADEAN
jgi:hypothetical protein